MLSLKGGLIAVSMLLLPLQGVTLYKLETRYPVPGNGGFDS
jgi:hypothetical protein